MRDARLVPQHLQLDLLGWKAKLDAHHALPSRVLEILQQALISRVVGHHQLELGWRLKRDIQAVDGQYAPMISQRMQDNRRVLPGFDDLVQIADRPGSHRTGKGTVGPYGAVALEEKASNKVRRRQVLMARHRDQFAPESVSHCLDQTCLADARRAFEHDRQTLTMSSLEHLDL